MKRTLHRHSPFYAIILITGAMLIGCTQQATMPERTLRSSIYVIPSTFGTFNAGAVHDAMLYFINTKYDVAAHSGYPNSFSEIAYDSLASLFITDSMQSSSGPFSSSQCALASRAFDSVFHLRQSAGHYTHAEIVETLDSGLAKGFYATDEVQFIKTADTNIRKCRTYSEANDTISALKSRYSTTTWASSGSHGVIANEYLNVAHASSLIWGGVNAEADTSTTGAVPLVAGQTVTDDADAMKQALEKYRQDQVIRGLTDDQVYQLAVAEATAASEAAGQGNRGVGVSVDPKSGGPEKLLEWFVAVVICILLGLT